MPRTLVFCAVWRLEPETVASLLSLEGQDHDLMFGYLAGRPGRQHHWQQYRRAWQVARASGYDALATVESDMIVPANMLTLLWETLNGGYDVANGLYVYRRSDVWNADAAELGAISASGKPGWGCALIGRRGLEIEPPRPAPSGAHCDSGWHDAAAAAGLKIAWDGRVVCGHKDRDGVILWPVPGGGARKERGIPSVALPWLEALRNAVRVRPVQAFGSVVGWWQPDGTIIVDGETAYSWIDAGLAEEAL